MIIPSYEHFYGVTVDWEFLSNIGQEKFFNNISNIKNTTLNDLIDIRQKFKNDSKWKQSLKRHEYVAAYNSQLDVKRGYLPEIIKW